MNQTSILTAKTGRPRSIPPEAYAEIFRLLALGLGYRAIADELGVRGICSCTKSSIERMVKGWCCYAGGFLLP